MFLAAISAMERGYGPDWKNFWTLINKKLSLTMLPIDLLQLIAQESLESDPLTAIHFTQILRSTYKHMVNVREAAKQACRLQWLPSLRQNDLTDIWDNGLGVTSSLLPHPVWAAGSLLPTRGRVSFSMLIECNYVPGSIFIGVCTMTNDHAWCLKPYYGTLSRLHHNIDSLSKFDDFAELVYDMPPTHQLPR